MRVRGLKHCFRRQAGINIAVAPRAGAWIETHALNRFDQPRHLSHPVRVRGLKQHRAGSRAVSRLVAPRAGAWIETLQPMPCRIRTLVAPRAGAWIETQCLVPQQTSVFRRTPCGCVD